MCVNLDRIEYEFVLSTNKTKKIMELTDTYKVKKELEKKKKHIQGPKILLHSFQLCTLC